MTCSATSLRNTARPGDRAVPTASQLPSDMAGLGIVDAKVDKGVACTIPCLGVGPTSSSGAQGAPFG
eukprot:CAMPEP_0197667570 /NCGR_PEP_ID=MMETSP1338-20131121/66829_1 /TAXON_ID=43686 ORGANISM="Pelagodinium beii, Strain RCC1491" /NCGR_SAMPLE_ID=MMETSP1338 /ASSEMBLY_ACC=CAM_ASM_000754 /LENGTH=66 /DNA_ID=CAMNT_0043246835 /DNA_START=31 /DNA_END=231 /DNA_ORIENTATION=-